MSQGLKIIDSVDLSPKHPIARFHFFYHVIGYLLLFHPSIEANLQHVNPHIHELKLYAFRSEKVLVSVLMVYWSYYHNSEFSTI